MSSPSLTSFWYHLTPYAIIYNDMGNKHWGRKEINNQDVRDLLHVSQSTATDYLTELLKSGKLKSKGKAKARIYKV